MKKNIIFCFTIVLLSVISCTDRFSLQDKEEYIDLYVTASLDTNETRTSLYEVPNTDSAYVQWSSNDTITLYCGQSKWSSSTATNITNNGRSAQFSFKVLSGEARTILTQGTSYIYYGKQSVSVDANGVPQSITLNATQVSDGSAAFNDGDNASFAVVSNDKFTVKYKDDGKTIDNITTTCTMNNVFSILKINVALQDSGKKLQSVNVTDKDSANVCLAGKFKITFTDGKPVVSFDTGSTGTDAVSSLEKKISSDISSGVFYYLIPPGTLKTGFKVSVFTKDGYYGGKTVTFKEGKQNPMVRSRIIEVPLKNFQPQNPIPVPDDQATANCYIVPAEAGTYSIPADYMGNGYQGNDTDYVPAKSNNNKINGAASAELIWQSKLNADVLIGGDIVSNVCFFERTVNSKTKHYIGFNRTGVPGNALVAVKDASGTILWSWHLWITNDVKEAALKSKVTIMDRNLGALSDTEAPMNHGCAYQFGRKDPFLGSRYCKISSAWSTNNENTFAKLYPSNAVSCYQSYEASGVKFTLSESIKRPNVRSMYPSPHWCEEGVDKTLNVEISWTYSDDDAKTLYDPCPVGWRVIKAQSLQHIVNNEGEGIVSDQGNSYKFNNIIFPTSGRSLESSGVAMVGTHAFLWYPAAVTDIVSGSTNTYSLQIDVEETKVTKGLITMNPNATLPVRCEKYTEPALPSSN